MSAKYARVVDGVVFETCDDAALATHHHDVAALFVKCPAKVQQNWTFTPPSAWSAPKKVDDK